MDDDKPFACAFSNCSQKFVTEDKLSYHMQKHDLNIGNLTASFFTDQTPTPTTFLRDCDNIGLFHDLPLASKNPFDESFRKAVIDPDADLVEADGSDSPSIPILPDSANVLGAINTPTLSSINTPTLGSINTPTSASDPPNFLKYRRVFRTPDINKLHSQLSNNGNLDTPSIDDRPSMLHRGLSGTTLPISNLVLGLPRPTHSRKSSTSTLSDSGAGTNSVDGTIYDMSPRREPTPTSASQEQDDILTMPPSSGKPDTSQQLPVGAADANHHMHVGANSSDTSQQALASQLSTSTTSTPSPPFIAVPERILAAGSTVPLGSAAPAGSNGGQSLVMLHINKSGSAYLIPANPLSQAAQAPAANQSPAPRKAVTTRNRGAPTNATRPLLPNTANRQLISASQQVLNHGVAFTPSQGDGQLLGASTTLSPTLFSSENILSEFDAMTAQGAPVYSPPQSSLALAKLKLKQSLAMHQKPASVSSNSSAVSQTTLSDSEANSRSSQSVGMHKRTMSRSDDDDLDEQGKRMKTLERNRDAARRCRKKKKFFIKTLEDKIKDVNHFNSQLQSENTKLKMEIAQLKSLFIAHKDCQVTQQQLSEGSLNSLLLG